MVFCQCDRICTKYRVAFWFLVGLNVTDILIRLSLSFVAGAR